MIENIFYIKITFDRNQLLSLYNISPHPSKLQITKSKNEYFIMIDEFFETIIVWHYKWITISEIIIMISEIIIMVSEILFLMDLGQNS